MTDTDKLKRLAEMAEWMRGSDEVFLAPSVANEHADDILALIAENERLRDGNDGLETDLRSAVQVAYRRGAVEWALLNYPQWAKWLIQCDKIA